MKTPIDKINSAVIIALHFFEKVNSFKKDYKTQQPTEEKYYSSHTIIFG
jgi:hypothetical protein